MKNSGSIEHAKDIYQDAFITVWTHVKNDKFTPKNDTAIQGYLYRIAKNKWTDILRSLDYEVLTFVKDEDTSEDQDLENNKLKRQCVRLKI